MKPQREVPAALAFTILSTSAALTAVSCGDQAPPDDAAVPCVYEAADNGNCPPPTCATGEHHDVCPAGCIAHVG
jgi:hypothetical protein